MTDIYMLSTLGLLLGSLGAIGVAAIGRRAGLVDLPNARSSHSIPTVKGGGVGILATLIFASLWCGLPGTVWIPASVLSCLSFWGDRVNLSPRFRLGIQLVCSAVVILGGFPFPMVCVLMVPLVIFLAGTSNFFNFMDGINGIAGGTGAIGFLFLALFGWQTSAPVSMVLVSGAVAFSCLGFLPFNVPNARVFMGDVGSVLLGFLFAALAILLSRNPGDFMCMVGFIFPFYADGLSTLTIRFWDGENLSQAHRRHLYQILSNERGMAHWKVTLGYCSLQIMIGAAVMGLAGDIRSTLVLLTMCFLVFCCVSMGVRHGCAGSKNYEKHRN